MTLPLAFTLLTGVAVLATSMALGLWQILSAPDRPNYPTSGRVKRLLMFWFMAALGYRGLEILTRATQPDPVYATGAQVAAALLMFGLFVTFLVDHLRHWLPARTHRRIQQLLRIAQCRSRKGLAEARASAMAASTGGRPPAVDVVGPALATLALEGATVVGPGEGPEALR